MTGGFLLLFFGGSAYMEMADSVKSDLRLLGLAFPPYAEKLYKIGLISTITAGLSAFILGILIYSSGKRIFGFLAVLTGTVALIGGFIPIGSIDYGSNGTFVFPLITPYHYIDVVLISISGIISVLILKKPDGGNLTEKSVIKT